MAQFKKRYVVFIIFGGIILVPVALLMILWAYIGATSISAKIVDFHPTNFEARAYAPFFYSIGAELKCSNQITPEARTIMRGQIRSFLVSPDSKRIAVVANGLLQVVDCGGSTNQKVTSVDSIYREPKPLGQQFYHDNDFQWSRDSKSLYLIKDEYYKSKGSQLFSSKGELWKYDLETGNMQLVLKPFPSHSYFFGARLSGVYFSVPIEKGDLILKYFDGNNVKEIENSNSLAIPIRALQTDFVESPFFSFTDLDYEYDTLATKGVHLASDPRNKLQTLTINNKLYLTLTSGESFKGTYYCSELRDSVFLPGDRYFLFNTPDCGNFDGQLLMDTQTSNYQKLPPNTRVYITLTTDTIPHYRITGSGIVSR